MRREGQARLGEDGDPQRLADQAPAFAALVDAHGAPRVPADRSVFAALVEAVCHQQLSMAAGASVHGNVLDRVGRPPTPRAVLEARPPALRQAGLSDAKTGYVRGLAEAFHEERLSEDTLAAMPDEAVLEALTSVRGIGTWTAKIAMLFAMHRPDVLPSGDLGLRDGARMVLGLDEQPSPARLEAIAEDWRPYRSLAAWYLWTERDARLREAGTR